MKPYIRAGMLLIGLILIWTIAHADTTTSGGTKTGGTAENNAEGDQDKFLAANNLEFTAGLTGDPDITINGWTFTISKFDTSTSSRRDEQDTPMILLNHAWAKRCCGIRDRVSRIPFSLTYFPVQR